MCKSKKIWNGFSEDPHTLPKDCVICFGGNVGDFVQLTCGHGGKGNYPLHVKCTILSFKPADLRRPQLPRCPVCRTQIDADTLARLADYVRRNDVVAFPDDDDQHQKASLCQGEAEEYKLLGFIVQAQEKSEGGGPVEPSDQEDGVAYWGGVIQDFTDLVSRAEGFAEERTYTLEELQDRLQEVRAAEEKSTVLAGKMIQYERAGLAVDVDPEAPSYEDLYDRFLKIRLCLEDVERRFVQQKQALEREREREESRHIAGPVTTV